MYELTGNETYHNAAGLSANFVRAQLYNGSVIGDTMNMSDCSITLAPASFDTGFFIEALSVLADKDSSWSSLSVIAC